MTREEFERLVAEGFLLIPEKFRNRMKNVAILVEDEPSEEVRKEEGLAEDETLLGHYQGIPAIARGADYGVGPTLPDAIVIYQKPTEEAASGDPKLIREIAAETVFHEFAHYLGMNEEEVLKWEKKDRFKK
ncbi:MAG: metallopeptidase family protein [bacterium]|nr:metallopeptidase family protein [bacterium]